LPIRALAVPVASKISPARCPSQAKVAPLRSMTGMLSILQALPQGLHNPQAASLRIVDP
jgi:hypothetical protein